MRLQRNAAHENCGFPGFHLLSFRGKLPPLADTALNHCFVQT
jgi:hypothetical protein